MYIHIIVYIVLHYTYWGHCRLSAKVEWPREWDTGHGLEYNRMGWNATGWSYAKMCATSVELC